MFIGVVLPTASNSKRAAVKFTLSAVHLADTRMSERPSWLISRTRTFSTVGFLHSGVPFNWRSVAARSVHPGMQPAGQTGAVPEHWIALQVATSQVTSE